MSAGCASCGSPVCALDHIARIDCQTGLAALKSRLEPWDYNRETYKRRNEVERLFRRLKGIRRIFPRLEKLDVMFVGFISFALVPDGLRLCSHTLSAPAYRLAGRNQIILDCGRC